MPHKNWAPNEAVYSADFNPDVADQVVAQYPDQATRNAAWPTPPAGAASAITGAAVTAGLELFLGGAWRPPWNTAWGAVGPPVVRTTNQAGNGGFPIDVAGLTFNWNAIANRRYKLTAQLVAQQSGAGAGVQNVAIRDASNNNQLIVAGGSVLAASFVTWAFCVFWSPGAGAMSVKVSVGTNAQTMDVSCTPSQLAFLAVEDVGPSGVPS
jgi:hypothetical protein